MQGQPRTEETWLKGELGCSKAEITCRPAVQPRVSGARKRRARGGGGRVKGVHKEGEAAGFAVQG